MENRISRLEKKYQFSSTEQDLNSQSETWIDSEYNDEKWNNIQLPLSWGESDF